MTRDRPIHPGEYLKEVYLVPGGLAEDQLVDVPADLVRALINRQCRISQSIANVLGKALNTSPEFWLNLQSSYDEESQID